MIAACLRRKCYLQWETRIYPNMYIVLVGPAGKCRKGTAMGPGMHFLNHLGIRLSAEATTREALIKALDETKDAMRGEGTMVITHSSLTIFSQELTVFLGYNNQQLMSDLTDWYDCRDKWTYRTKGQGTDEIVGVWVNLIGATTPELVQSTLPKDAIGGGLTSRMIFVYEEKKGRISPTPFLDSQELELEADLKLDLEAIAMMMGEFHPDQSFIERWIEWYPVQDANPPFKEPALQGYNSRRQTHALKLSMILNASRGGDMILTAQDLNRAISTIEEIEVNMAKTFSGYGLGRSSEVMSRIITEIAICKQIRFSDLLLRFKNDVDDQGHLIRIVVTLERMKICKVVTDADHKDMTITYTPRENG